VAGPTLRVDNVSKLYRIGSASDLQSGSDGPLLRALRSPLNNYRKYRSLYRFTPAELAGAAESADVLWALRDVSFAAEAGEVLGIVGANGAGKSTLLKVVSRITPPTRGRVRLQGRVSCLLEVGTGFHPELTGRENIYMSSTILGMRKREVDARFEEIVEFSGVGPFIDTPVKRYSSGMNVRLAFAVMAHLEPELLIVDEVLAVGDAEFQRKCLNTMSTVGKHGKTVLFVSHNMAAITRLCDRGLLMRGGRLVLDGGAADIVHAHLTAGGSDIANREWPELTAAPGDDAVRLRAVRAVSARGAPIGSVKSTEPVAVQIVYDVLEPGHVLSPYFTVVSEAGIDLFTTADSTPGCDQEAREVGRYTATVTIPPKLLAEGRHYVRVVMRSVRAKYRPFTERDVIAFTIVDSVGGLQDSWWEGKPSGVIRPALDWRTEYTQPQMVFDRGD